MIDTCYNCGQPGHFASSCPAVERPRDQKPPWCGNCDRLTRLVDHGAYMARCSGCHPLAFKPLPQTHRCGGCNHLVYVWDTTPCDHEMHGIGRVAHSPRPPLGASLCNDKTLSDGTQR